MGEHFIKEIEIKDYKCFRNFKADGFARVNLIGGKNNVGKTAFMEACYINIYTFSVSSLVHSIMNSYIMRNFVELLKNTTNRDKVSKDYLEHIGRYESFSNINKVFFGINNYDGIKEYSFNINGEKRVININDFSIDEHARNSKVIFLANKPLPNIILKTYYENLQKKNKEEILCKYIRSFDNNIINFKIIGGDKPQCQIESGEYIDINEFGDGLKQFIALISVLYVADSGYLFIDEIENGIHYTKLDDMWKIVLTLSKQNNVQVFATTHSKECIESYARVSNELKDDDISLIELGKDKQDNLKAIVMNNQRFQRELKNGNGVRGW